jgi:hypothetical protein
MVEAKGFVESKGKSGNRESTPGTSAVKIFTVVNIIAFL